MPVDPPPREPGLPGESEPPREHESPGEPEMPPEHESPRKPETTPGADATGQAEPNSAVLEGLFAEGRIRLERAPILGEAPAPIERPDLGDHVEGMLLGLAIGDALGNTSEGMTPQMRGMTHGEITEYLPNVRARHRPVGLPSDDTQLAFRTLEQMLEDGRIVPDRLADRFAAEPVAGMGGTVAAFIHSYRNLGKRWDEAAPHSAGNGALMRIAPVLLPYLRSPSTELWADTAVAATLTHNDEASTAASIALIRTLWESMRLESAPDTEWWLETFIGTMRPLEGDTAYRPRTLRLTYEGPVSDFAEEQVRRALAHELAVADACEEWLSGAYLLETIPSVLMILCRFGDDPERAIVRAVNDTVDNDTIGAVVGAAVGALHGRSALPLRWIDGLLGRVGEQDDGRVFELIAEACSRWV